MVASFSLAPEPVWYLVNTDGTAAGGAFLKTMSNINPLIPKDTFRDPAGHVAWPNPIQFNMNGTNPPIYWEFDPADPTDTYYLEVTDAQGNPLWQAQNFFPGGGGGGGGDTISFLPLRNYIANNQFIDNTGTSASPIGGSSATSLVIAPSNHQGFTPYTSNPINGVFGALGPDIMYVRSAASAPPTDQIIIGTFPLNTQPMVPTDVTPVNYIEYVCTGAGNETFKAIQFPITQKVMNLSQQAMTFCFWAKVAVNPVDINFYTRQYYGTSPTATVETDTGGNPTRVLQGTRTLTTTWTQYFINFNMPNVSVNSLGTPGAQTDDDAVYLQLGMPLNAVCDVLFTKPKLYLGTLPNNSEFDTYDEINSVNSTPRCGDIRTSFTSSPPPGWLAMNDTTLGNVGSAATNRSAAYFQLYKTLWDGISQPSGNVYASVAPSLGSSAVADFLANKVMALPLSLARAMANIGGGAVLGQSSGSASVTLGVGNLPPGTPWNTSGVTGDINVVPAGTVTHAPGSNVGTYTNTPVTTPFSIIPPTTYFNVFIKT